MAIALEEFPSLAKVVVPLTTVEVSSDSASPATSPSTATFSKTLYPDRSFHSSTGAAVVSLSYLEVYNEGVYDLLGTSVEGEALGVRRFKIVIDCAKSVLELCYEFAVQMPSPCTSLADGAVSLSPRGLRASQALPVLRLCRTAPRDVKCARPVPSGA